MPVVLTIAGSDSGGGAGIQADLKTFAALQVFGTSAITCITAQNPKEVACIAPISPDMVVLQIETVCRGFRVSTAKTGMLYSESIVRAVAEAIRECRIKILVVDPVMVATSGARLLKKDAVKALCSELLPLASVVTPNISEAQVLCGHRIRSIEDMKSAAFAIGEKFGCACVVKGGHLRSESRSQKSVRNLGLLAPGEVGGQRAGGRKKSKELITDAQAVDVLYNGERTKVFVLPRVVGVKTHGTGCTFSAALTAFLAHGIELPEAVRRAKRFVASNLLHRCIGS